MPYIYVSNDDYRYLELYSDAFSVSIENVIHRRIEILKSATSFCVRMALDCGAEGNSRIEALCDVSSSFSIASAVSEANLLTNKIGNQASLIPDVVSN